MKIPRRELLQTAGGAALLAAEPAPSAPEEHAVRNTDRAVDHYLSTQTSDPKSRWFGGFADADGLHSGGSAMSVFDHFSAAFLHPRSKHFQSPAAFQCLRRAADFLDRHSTPDGNINLLITNFNSPPDTAFGARGMAMGARLAQLKQHRELLGLIQPRLVRAGRGLVKGGVHTPNHRWIVCASLAQIHEVFPDPSYPRRIGQWLAEGIDIDEDGQYTERSTGTYNMVVNSSLVILADKLKRPDLLEPVRRNLDSVLHLMDANGELMTAISSRQDRGTRATIASYFFPLQYLAVHDRNPVYAGLAQPHMRDYLQLSYLMIWPELGRTGLPAAPPPSGYTRHFARMGVTRIRHGLTSAAILSQGHSRFFQYRHGAAAVNAVRFASGFFGKGQFFASGLTRSGDAHVLSQELSAPYYQPLDRAVGMEFEEVRNQRAHSEVCRLKQRVEIRERSGGFELVIEAEGTGEVPVTVEINFREGGELEGVRPASLPDAWYLPEGHAIYRAGKEAIRFGPGRHEHRWIAVRGAEPKMEGPSVFLTGFTPFRHVLAFRPAG